MEVNISDKLIKIWASWIPAFAGMTLCVGVFAEAMAGSSFAKPALRVSKTSWSGVRESNPSPQHGKLLYYRCTNPAYGVVFTARAAGWQEGAELGSKRKRDSTSRKAMVRKCSPGFSRLE